MNYKIIDLPKQYELEDYSTAISSFIEKLRHNSSVVSIYQIGFVKSPGISDIDILIIFKDDKKICFENLDLINKKNNYLFAHGIFGCSKSLINKLFKYNYLNNPKLLFGEDIELIHNHKPSNVIKKQIALEYLIKSFIDTLWHHDSGIIKLRKLFLHIHSLKYDLEILDIKSGDFFNLVHENIKWRENWFFDPVGEDKIFKWHSRFILSFESFLKKELSKHTFYFLNDSISIGKTIQIVASNEINYIIKGFKIPKKLNFLGYKYISMKNRLNRIELSLPIKTNQLPDDIIDRYKYNENLYSYVKKYCPNFSCPISGFINFN